MGEWYHETVYRPFPIKDTLVNCLLFWCSSILMLFYSYASVIAVYGPNRTVKKGSLGLVLQVCPFKAMNECRTVWPDTILDTILSLSKIKVLFINKISTYTDITGNSLTFCEEWRVGWPTHCRCCLYMFD